MICMIRRLISHRGKYQYENDNTGLLLATQSGTSTTQILYHDSQVTPQGGTTMQKSRVIRTFGLTGGLLLQGRVRPPGILNNAANGPGEDLETGTTIR